MKRKNDEKKNERDRERDLHGEVKKRRRITSCSFECMSKRKQSSAKVKESRNSNHPPHMTHNHMTNIKRTQK